MERGRRPGGGVTMRGTDGVMLARNRVLAELERGAEVSPDLCAIVNWVICGDEGLGIEALFPAEAAERLMAACTLACPLPNRGH